jgi:ribonuclease HII
MIVGVDEVGRGAWAGPLVVGAVILGGIEIEELTDSKKLTAKKRQLLAREIKENAIAIGLGWVSAVTIDKIGLSKGLTLATERALREISVPYDQIIIDGTVDFLNDPRVTTMKQADLLVPSVSAASIVAKVARDYYMCTKVHEEYPEYGFNSHVGYGTAAHKRALIQHGVSSFHRTSFRPIRELLGEVDIPKISKVDDTVGRKAEIAATLYLEHHGFTIVAQNWKTKYCEIDIVAHKKDIVYFVEVKHRNSDDQGGGLATITKKKLHQMKFAAEFWRHNEHHTGHARLAVVITSNDPPEVTQFLEVE